MAKLQSTLKNMFLSLSIICLTVAVLLAQVNKMTAKPIADAKAMTTSCLSVMAGIYT